MQYFPTKKKNCSKGTWSGTKNVSMLNLSFTFKKWQRKFNSLLYFIFHHSRKKPPVVTTYICHYSIISSSLRTRTHTSYFPNQNYYFCCDKFFPKWKKSINIICCCSSIRCVSSITIFIPRRNIDSPYHPTRIYNHLQESVRKMCGHLSRYILWH